MLIFILEDNKERVNFFRQELDDNNELTIVDDIGMSKKFLKQENYDILFLDHDLGGRVDSNEDNTGYQVAKFIVKNKLQLTSTIFIHSLNPVGSKLMYDLFKDNDYQVAITPFTEIYKMRKK